MESTYKIRVKTLENNILTFSNVKSYKLDNGMIRFIDSKKGVLKIFSTQQCEIEPEEGDKK